VQILEALKSTYLAAGLTETQLASISELATERNFMPASRIIKQGDTGSDLFVIIQGRVNILTPDGDKLAEVGPGSVLGEISLIDARPRTADAVCIGNVQAAVFDAKILRSHMNQDRDMGFMVLANLSRVLCGRLRDTNAKVDALIDKTADTWKNAL
jgi:CRP/FNR family cyclic AMP-dependent transcriptional regulator